MKNGVKVLYYIMPSSGETAAVLEVATGPQMPQDDDEYDDPIFEPDEDDEES